MKFIQKLFGTSDNSKNHTEGQFIRIILNDKIMPVDRGFIYEDPLDEMLKRHKIGEVTGGGTLQFESGEIKSCELEVFINSELIDSITLKSLKDKIEELGAPKGSKIKIERTKKEISVGKLEGIGIYLDGQNLPKSVYEDNDINLVIEKIKKLLDDKTDMTRYWEGSKNTALYFYGLSFNDMKEKVIDFLNKHPLCKNAKIEQLA